ncbi:hypothetical protein J0H58_23460 [bacterium]|nr:hypothetical protein [bacterium]
MIVSGGQVYAYRAGNRNAVGSGILSGRPRFASWLRVISGDTGAILSESFNRDGAYNTAVAPDDTCGIDRFVVTFDRPVNENVSGPGFTELSADPANYVFRYHNPYDRVGIDTVFAATSVAPAGGNSFPIRFQVGTYSYSVSNVRDRVRTVSGGGNQMDQDADGSWVRPISTRSPCGLRLAGPVHGPRDGLAGGLRRRERFCGGEISWLCAGA